MFKFDVKTTMNANAKVEFLKSENSIWYYKFTVDNPNKEKIEQVKLYTTTDARGAYSVWGSKLMCERRIRPSWKPSIAESRISSGTPTLEIMDAACNNVANISILDAATPLNIKGGIIEWDGKLQLMIDFFVLPVSVFEHYETIIRIDLRQMPYYETLKEVGDWWRTEGGYAEAPVPDTALRPHNSAWYSYHQSIIADEIVEECRRSKELGMESIILDDGWQTDNVNLGYGYCGDWEVAKTKISDMAEFSKRIHETGLAFMIWYSVPFIGFHSKMYESFKDKLLYSRENHSCAILDPRYPDVREYLISTYENALKDWNLDGLKLDFIDSFTLMNQDEAFDERRDYHSVEDATAKLLADISVRLRAIKPDVCIEFRQTYIGPIAASCGNMLRVGDCPGAPTTNRIGIADLRLLTDKTAVHSDMIMWDLEDTPENAANQFIAVMFGVPQISMKIFELPDSHYKMLKFYLNLWNENRDLLLKGKFKPYNPEANYSLITSENDNDIIAVAYSKNILTLNKSYKNITLVNGTGTNKIVIEKDGFDAEYDYKILDCMGGLVSTGKFDGKTDIKAFSVPVSGVIKLKQRRSIRTRLK